MKFSETGVGNDNSILERKSSFVESILSKYDEAIEKLNDEINEIWNADNKVDSEELSDVNDDQSNYNSMRWIIFCSSIVLMMHRCYRRFYNLFHDHIFFPIKYRSLYSFVFHAFFSRRRNDIRL